ncbi:enoyl-CoA hydratase/isomerase family protein [Paenarthrobacter sp. DKR-5]|uniref:enoyl-CoA hydratase/isomerase family protein n=1 Tax=Paenarthrobacter sp. DKR-5 TaxID=2835535 RepID=UPI001BDBB65B|nr:enoyl-CoA hydratase-related protein [Paenarthrobacter sp. DKR-5]MBT1001494.1 enoyl-CoA hydratase/isomerase family protein [Paenarthrobacter sp. DKR-5]
MDTHAGLGRFDTLLVEVLDGVATVSINRPDALNALARAVIDDLAELVRRLRHNVNHAPDTGWPVRAVLLTGAGEKAFAAGADVREMAGMTPEQAFDYSRSMQEVTLALEELPLPVIACVHGYALGGGCELAMACDFIYASSSAAFGQPEVDLGLVPGFGGSVRLQRLVGPARARELILTGRRIGAEEAERIGLVNAVLGSKEELLAAARATALKIAAKSPVAVGLAKEAVRTAQGLDTAAALQGEAAVFRRAFGTADMREGTAAFLARRPPEFPGR